MPRRRVAKQNREDLWIEATTKCINERTKIQVVGLTSKTGTCFARVLKSTDNVTVQELVDVVRQEMGQLHPEHSFLDTIELLQLGSVWILDPQLGPNAQHPHNAPKWQRVSSQENHILHDSSMIRIHTRPARYLSNWSVSDQLIYQSKHLTVLDKPSGVPSHATVDNGIENALCMYMHYSNTSYATLPHRLDVETSGLLLIATTKAMSSHLSKCFQAKTTIQDSSSTTTTAVLEKQYRCLVRILSENVYQSLRDRQKQVIQHYVDSTSSAPKVFRDEIPSDKETTCQSKWQECRLSVEEVGSLLKWTGDNMTLPSNTHIAELRIRLFTGRTHQIRGQLAALGCPIVGDVLYGNDSSFQRMALQCCRMEFPDLDGNVLQFESQGPPWWRDVCHAS